MCVVCACVRVCSVCGVCSVRVCERERTREKERETVGEGGKFLYMICRGYLPDVCMYVYVCACVCVCVRMHVCT